MQSTAAGCVFPESGRVSVLESEGLSLEDVRISGVWGISVQDVRVSQVWGV